MKYLLLVIGLLFLIPACAVESNTESLVDTSNENNPAPTAATATQAAATTTQTAATTTQVPPPKYTYICDYKPFD